MKKCLKCEEVKDLICVYKVKSQKYKVYKYYACKSHFNEIKTLRIMRTKLAVRKWRTKHPERVKAHRKVFVEVRAKRIVPLPCKVCGKNKTEAHHEDYSKPLEILWLCRKHHLELDKVRRNEVINT